MQYFKNISILSFVLVLTLASCKKDEPTPQIDPPKISHYTVKFGAGSNWNTNEPIFKQDIMEHGNYQFGLFNDGTLKMAGFLLESDQARYFQAVTTKNAIDKIIADDPAIKDKTFSVLEKEGVAILIQQVPDSTTMIDKSQFIVEYTPDSAWEASKKLWELDLADHQNYIGGKFGDKFVLRGLQYLNKDKAMYIILAKDKSKVQDFINNDPAVKSNLFKGTIAPYTVNVSQL